ncbi:M24 family metallopeptidase [Nocardioides sp. BYT-33-1]|uniref:M24 family metallopeptidase n=1 Tax=Nocardioides sp. BYT-33-1 TaxID=3416952 RepID=UPI003F530CC2
MPRIVFDADQIERDYGFRPQDRLLFSAIRLDSHRFVMPLIYQGDGGQTLLVRQQEQGNVLSAGVAPEQLRFYEPWVTIDPRPVADFPAAPSLPALVRDLAGGAGVELDERAPYVHYSALAGEVEVKVPRAPSPRALVFEVDQEQVLERFRAWRREGVTTARRLIDELPHLAGLEKDLGADADTRYSGLREVARELDVQALVISSAPNYSEIVGRPAADGVVALWLQDDERLLVIAEEGVRSVHGTPVSRHDSVAAAIVAYAGGSRVGFEEQWERTALALDLMELGVRPVSASRALGSWRDVRDHEDLAFHIIAARASVTAIDAAVAWGHARLDAGESTTEREMYAVYLDALDEFRLTQRVPFAIEPYFTNLHSSQRMLFPGPPTDFPIDEDTTCVQLDAGVKVTIDGVTVATSDMARSMLRTPEGKEAYEILTTAVRDVIIGQLEPGVVCEDVHARTLAHLAEVRPRMIELGLLGPEVDFDTEYRKRNVGHLMGKQESFANELRPGYRHVLHVGSYGAAEIPWRYGRHAIGTEDLWFIGSEGTYNLTLS